jgi:hypothetical protein
MPAPAIETALEIAADHSALHNDGVAAEGTVLWREGEGIVPAADAATEDEPLGLAVEGGHDTGSGNHLDEAAAACTSQSPRDSPEIDSSWMYDGTEQTPPATPVLGSHLANVDGECSDSAGADRPVTTQLASHVFLLAGAVSADALHLRRGEFSMDRLRAANVTVAYSSNDSVSSTHRERLFSFYRHWAISMS